MLEGDKPIICAGKSGLISCGVPTGYIYYRDTMNPESWSMGEEEPCPMCGVAMLYTKACFQCPACGFKEGCG